MRRVLAAMIGLGVLAGALILKGKPGEPATLSGNAMGTRWTLVWRGEAPPELRREVSAVIERWEQVLSQWRDESDLSRHNRGAAATPDLARVIALADEVRLASGGAFDHRMLGQVHASGFGPPGRGIDLSAIGKGFTVDRVGERLRQLGVGDFVFELGGEVLAGDGGWVVGVERPLPDGRGVVREIRLRNRALATSGNYRQFTPGEVGLKSHLIDPASGEPLQRPPSSVTVIAADCTTADAWATALFILGPDFQEMPADLEVRWQLESADPTSAAPSSALRAMNPR